MLTTKTDKNPSITSR